MNNLQCVRTGGRVVEGTGLENRHTGDPGIVSSNLTLSVVVGADGRLFWWEGLGISD
jgi:hypothetical protein